MKTSLLLLLLAGCSFVPPADVAGPFTGDVRRFAVDSLTLPQDRIAFSDDLNGDGRADNQFGNLMGAVTANNISWPTDDGPSAIELGAIKSFVEIQSDDGSLSDDDTVSVRFVGANGEAAVAVGGTLQAGSFTSNRSRWTRVPGSASAHLPILIDANPTVLALEGMEIDFQPDARGLTAEIRGVARVNDALVPIFYTSFMQTFAADAGARPLLLQQFDFDHDGTISEQEFAGDWLVKNLLNPDVQMFDAAGYHPNPSNANRDSLSVAFQVHLSPQN